MILQAAFLLICSLVLLLDGSEGKASQDDQQDGQHSQSIQVKVVMHEISRLYSQKDMMMVSVMLQCAITIETACG